MAPGIARSGSTWLRRTRDCRERWEKISNEGWIRIFILKRSADIPAESMSRDLGCGGRGCLVYGIAGRWMSARPHRKRQTGTTTTREEPFSAYKLRSLCAMANPVVVSQNRPERDDESVMWAATADHECGSRRGRSWVSGETRGCRLLSRWYRRCRGLAADVQCVVERTPVQPDAMVTCGGGGGRCARAQARLWTLGWGAVSGYCSGCLPGWVYDGSVVGSASSVPRGW